MRKPRHGVRRVTITRRLTPAPIILLCGVLLALVAVATERALAVPFALAAVLFALALTLRARSDPEGPEARTLMHIGEWSLPVLPGLLVVYFSFNGGGYFPGSVAFVAMLLALALAVRMAIVQEPLAGFGPAAAVAAGALLLYALWTLLSQEWSNAPGRALVDFDRALLYLLALVLFASVPRTRRRMERMIRGLAAGATLVCLIGLVTRVLPDVWPIAPDIQQGRLSYPITYWNALGLLAAIAITLCAYLTTSEREPRTIRVASAAALPPLAAALYFTFSRGGIGVAVIGLVVYALLARPRGLLGGLLAAGPSCAVAVWIAYGADLLASDDPTSAAATAQGHDVALAVLLCALGAAVVRLAALPLDGLIARAHLPVRLRRPVLTAAWSLGVIAAVAVFLGAGGPREVREAYDGFVHGNEVPLGGDLRERLTNPGNNKRIEQWDVGMRGYESAEFRGHGAGTYQNRWYEERETAFVIRDAHSLYVETLDELGISGTVLLAVALLTLIGAFAWRIRRRGRYLYAALFAIALAWAVRAGVDWDWEMPALTLWLFAFGGAALALDEESLSSRRAKLPAAARAGLAVGCVALAAVPATIVVSQNRIDESTRALARGDCGSAAEAARTAVDLLPFRPEPYRVLGYCAARAERFELAIREIENAIERDPENWEYHYDLALMRAAAGLDAREPAARAARLAPLDPVATRPQRLQQSGRRKLRAAARDLLLAR